jgi:GcrA cell cycle regulator
LRSGERGCGSVCCDALSPADFALCQRLQPLAAPVARGLRPVGGPETGRGNREAIRMTLETWTPERVEQLRNYVVNGLTCSQIAAQIGVSRNAVIGKIHRLGLSPGRPPGGSARSCPPRARHPRAAGQRRLLQLMWSDGAVAPGAAAALAPVESREPCSLLDLEHGKCRWPLADDGRNAGADADVMFCGNPAIEGLSYCAGHARMAYRVPARRRA